LWLVDVVERALWKRLSAGDHFLYGGSDKCKFRYQQHTKLDGNRGNEHRHHARDIHIHIGKRFNQHEPNGDDHLHSDSNQCLWLDYVYGNRYRKHGKQTSDQRLHGEPHKHHFGLQQHAELDDDGGDQSCHYTGNIHFHIREWVDEREPIRDNHLHAYCDQCCWFDRIYG
jgi:hypothetical protein